MIRRENREKKPGGKGRCQKSEILKSTTYAVRSSEFNIKTRGSCWKINKPKRNTVKFVFQKTGSPTLFTLFTIAVFP